MVALLHPTGPGKQIIIDRAVVLVGRSPECDAILDISSRISRMHCALIQADSCYFIRDLGSLNGVRVNGSRITMQSQLIHGTTVSIGDVQFQFLENSATAAKSAAAGQKKSEADRVYPVLVDNSRNASPDDVLEAELVDDEELNCVDAEILDEVEVIEETDFPDEEINDVIEIIDDEVEMVDDLEIIDDPEIIEIRDADDDISPSRRRNGRR